MEYRASFLIQIKEFACAAIEAGRANAEPWTRPSLINVIVQDGTVELWGIVDSASEKKAVRIAAEVTPGVRAVNDNLIIRPAQAGY
jgi:hypothetical protein